MGSMFKGDDLDALINEAISDKPRQRTAQTASLLRALADALMQQVEKRSAFRGQYAKTAGTAGNHEQRAALRPFQGDYDGADDVDILSGAWLRRLSNLPAALEPTVAAVIDAVVFCDKPTDVKSALAHLAAKTDKKIHLERARQLVKEYPPYGAASHEDRGQVDFKELGQKREARDRKS